MGGMKEVNQIMNQNLVVGSRVGIVHLEMVKEYTDCG